jgi:type III restriction enzyme
MKDQISIEDPILNSPFAEPKWHYELNKEGLTGKILPGRRNSCYYVPVPPPRSKGKQAEFQEFKEIGIEENEFINQVRSRVRIWRSKDYPGVTSTTRKLLNHWTNPTKERKLFYCQIEAVETAIYIAEIAGRNSDGWIETDLRKANDDNNPGLFRIALKMATGSGKTVVMSMLIAWQALNKQSNRQDARFTDKFLLVTPGITIRDRLNVLLPSNPGNYYAERDILPPGYMDKIGQAKIVILNYHSFMPRETVEAGKLVKSVLRGDFKETPAQMVTRVTRELGGAKSQIIVINDEAHHCYRQKVEDVADLSGEDKKEAEERNRYARVWISGLEAIQKKLGIKAVYDMSATPFFLRGSGYDEGTLFPWVVSDFSLIDAIESGIVKVPRVPVIDNSLQSRLPIYRNIYPHVKDRLPKKGRKNEDEQGDPRVPKELEGALEALYSNYKKEYELWEKQSAHTGTTPPVFIVVCNNTNVSKMIYDFVAGYEKTTKNGKAVLKRSDYELFENHDGKEWYHQPRTILVDSEQLDSGESLSADFKAIAQHQVEEFKADYVRRYPGRSADQITDEEMMREVMNTVGKPGKLGANIRCVVSVSMLTEGWDANTVTHILGVRAFGTQLLCEQVVGRGLRRMSYQTIRKTIDINGKSTEIETFPIEYAEVFGVPFDFLKTTGKGGTGEPPPKPNHVRAMPDRSALEITFPRLIGYRYDIRETALNVKFTDDSKMKLTTRDVPTNVENSPLIGEVRVMSLDDLKERREQEIEFRLARRVLSKFFPLSKEDEEKDIDASGVKYWLYPQVLAAVRQWLETCLILTDDTFKQMLLLVEYAETAADKIGRALVAGTAGEKIIKAIPERYDTIGSTSYVDFHTAKPVYATKANKCHVSHVVCDTTQWEQRMAQKIESLDEVFCYVKNENLGFTIPYTFEGRPRTYIPDFILKIDDGHGIDDALHLILEVTGFKFEEKEAKADTVQKFWVPAVNNEGRWGRWAFLEITDIETAKESLIAFILSLKTKAA